MQTLSTVKHHWIVRYTGRLRHAPLREARAAIRKWPT